MNIPGKRDINPHDCLDGIFAEKRWLGKSLSDGVQIIKENPYVAEEDFIHMGLPAFVYYFGSIRDYVFLGMASGGEDFISSILGTLLLRVEEVINSRHDYSIIKEFLILVDNKFDEIYESSLSRERDKFILNELKQIYNGQIKCDATRMAMTNNLTKILMGRKKL